ncbi:hypothetical protein SADUNF_Sadunf14G0003300 [Salix dunnii]|uniref:Uncharacterized protein n=1 Tax=Salix dunnii TaxID=1413687 RepID=A0A835MJU5_9ROSI|nr:hypothetical protein SADUNF_Sadunf14G0003300 [Salix dunnii]
MDAVFVSTAAAVYLDRTMHINTYDELFAGSTNPMHETKVREVLVSICNGAVETLVKTSHQALTADDSNLNSSSDSPVWPLIKKKAQWRTRKSVAEVKENGLVNKVSSTSAVPSNRRLVLDMTGRVTFETVRSFMEFLLEKLCTGIRRCVDFSHEVAVDNVVQFCHGLMMFADPKPTLYSNSP